MKKFAYLTFLLFLNQSFGQISKTDVFILGSDHLLQVYKPSFPATDVFNTQRQKEMDTFINLVIKYNPDSIMVEVLPEKQKQIDSLYSLYTNNLIKLDDIEDGRSEVYQIAFKIGKKLKIKKICCVNAPGGTSQSILDNGKNIELYKNENVELSKIVKEKYAALQNNTLSFLDYLKFLNKPETIHKVYHLKYITPSRITNGTFKNPDEMVNTAFINTKYIGAELTSIFKNRDYKIYSNIIENTQLDKPKKILLLIGVAHIGSLKNIFRDDEEFNLISAEKYLKI